MPTHPSRFPRELVVPPFGPPSKTSEPLLNAEEDDAKNEEGQVNFAGLEAWFAQSSKDNENMSTGIFERGLKRYLPDGKLGDQICK